MKTNGKGTVVIGFVLAAVMLASVFTMMVGNVEAYSNGGKYNIIKKDGAETLQPVIIGQSLDFFTNWGARNIVTLSRVKDNSIEWMKKADPGNTLKITGDAYMEDGAFYVNYDESTGTSDARLSFSDAYIPLTIKVGTRMVSPSIYEGTSITISTFGMNLFKEDVVDLKVIGPIGPIKYDEKNDQQFTNITVADLKANFGDNNLKTDGWDIGEYLFQVKTKPANTCGLDAASDVKYLKLIRGEIFIDAYVTSTVEHETIYFIVVGVPGDKIKISAIVTDAAVFREGVDDTPTGDCYHGNWFTDAIDLDGLRRYAVKFTEAGNYTIKVKVTNGKCEGDYDTVDMRVYERAVHFFDLPSTVMIFDKKLTIRGTATSGSFVSVFIDDKLYDKLSNIVVDEFGEFSKEIRTSEVGLTVPGTVTLKAWLDCDKKPGESPPATSADGSADILVLGTPLDTTISKSTVSIGDSFEVYGYAPSNYVEILMISPKGVDGTGIGGLFGTTIYTVHTFCDHADYNFYKKIEVSRDADYGNYTIIVLTPGCDKTYGNTEYTFIDSILDLDGEGQELGVLDVSQMAQEEFAALIDDIIYATGGDDYMKVGNIVVTQLETSDTDGGFFQTFLEHTRGILDKWRNILFK